MRLASATIIVFLLLAGTSSADVRCEPLHLKPLRCVRGKVIDVTGEDGRFSFDGLVAGQYDLHAAAFGFALFRFPIVLQNPKTKCNRALEITLALGLEACDNIRLVKR
jgi:hypothetical protein